MICLSILFLYFQRQTTDKVPDFRLLKKHLADPDFIEKKPEVIDLIYWVVLQLKDYKLETVPKSQVIFFFENKTLNNCI